MRFTQSELELIGQCTTSDKILALTELRAVRRETDDPLKKEIVEDTIDKLLEVPEPECSRFIADTIIRFQERETSSVRDRLAALKAFVLALSRLPGVLELPKKEPESGGTE